jgi:hypothetical protein
MPALSTADAATIRQDYHTVKRYLSPWPRNVVLRATATSVSKDTDTNGIYEIGFDTVTLGTYQNAVAGYTLDVYTSGGVRRGSLRLRKDATASTLYVAESAPGEVNVTVGDTLEVIKERKIWRKLPYLAQTNTNTQDFFDTFEIYKDYDLAYTDENEDHRPVANIEYKPADFLDTGQDYRTVYLNGANSEPVADGATISSYSWDIGTGSFAPGYTASDSAIYARFPSGEHEVSLTVTDSNSKASTRYAPVWAHGPGFQPLAESAFRKNRDDTEYGQGRNIDLTIFGNSYEARDELIPQGTLFCYWEVAEFGAQDAPPDQYRGQYLGWAARDATLITLDFGEYTISLENAAAQLARIDGSEQLFLRRSSPSEWYEMIDITSDRQLAHILRYETTALDVCNLYLSGVTDEWGQKSGSNFGAGTVDKAPIWQQLTALTAEYGGVASADSLNGIWLRRHPSLVEDGGSGRDDIATIIELDNDDWLADGIELPNEFTPRVGQLEMDGFAFDGSQVSLFQSKAPGRVPSFPASREAGPAQVLPTTSSQDVLASRAGKRLAWSNNPRPEIPIPLWGNFDVFEPAWMEWVTLTVDENNIRGIEIASGRYLVKRVSIRDSNDPDQPAKRIVLTVEQETDGESGEAWEAPESETVDTSGDSYDWPGLDYGPYDGWNMFPGDSLGTDIYDSAGAASSPSLVYAADERYVKRTENFLDATPTWTTVFDAVTDVGASYVILEYQPDNLDPKEKAIVVVGDTSSETRVYRTTNLSSVTPTFTLVRTFTFDAIRAVLQNSIFSGMWFLLLQGGYLGNTEYFYKTSDNFATLDTSLTDPCGIPPSADHTLFISNHIASTTSGLIVMSYGAGGGDSHVTISRDYGGSFTPDLSWTFNDFHPPVYVHVPYQGNEGENTWYVMGGEDSNKDAWIYRTKNGGTSYTEISPLYDDGRSGDGILPYGGGERDRYIRRLIYDYTKDSNKITVLAQPSKDRYGGHFWNVFSSDDAGDIWTHRAEITTPLHAIGGWPHDENILFITGASVLLYSEDRGATWVQKQWSGYADGIWTVPIWVA